MPSEPQLAALTGASRTSVREALIRLEERGYIHRSHGARTVIHSHLDQLGTRVDQQRDHLEAIARAGYRPSVRVVSAAFGVVERSPNGPEQFHDLPIGTRVLRTRKVWSADGHPYVMADDVIPVTDTRASEVLETDLDPSMPVFDLAESLNGVAVAWETVWFGSSMLADDERDALGLETTAPALELTYCGVGPTREVAYWCREVQTPAPAQLRNVLVRRVTRG
ncbi:GntR family transcriptional regulator [Microbacterium sp. RURRCA19A]|nr:GntR family transcriptional regulator [Microbacterium sp. RURRCA19A]